MKKGKKKKNNRKKNKPPPTPKKERNKENWYEMQADLLESRFSRKIGQNFGYIQNDANNWFYYSSDCNSLIKLVSFICEQVTQSLANSCITS